MAILLRGTWMGRSCEKTKFYRGAYRGMPASRREDANELLDAETSRLAAAHDISVRVLARIETIPEDDSNGKGHTPPVQLRAKPRGPRPMQRFGGSPDGSGMRSIGTDLLSQRRPVSGCERITDCDRRTDWHSAAIRMTSTFAPGIAKPSETRLCSIADEASTFRYVVNR
ncbi:hypothetical protein [Burkholderia multivorans]|uniref:hypothetical protein n=2 Tax=Burkholderia multivorans TaxID=87883 RepID=UPI001C237F39|nr:hypothetical protein [Burkholderia multivorans]MBU9409742.1 hypothetical protein [Burkholderia multivorans]MDN7742513.1 hypothetical protein [Burkholderia multivorans]UXZ85170.1 hypothetical protein NUJ31_17205 [Burkholderia multivorans]